MTQLRLTFLGSPAVRLGDRAVTFPTRKTLALLVYLVVEEGAHSREKLAALFWPESDAARARGSLRSAIAFLRRALDDSPRPPGTHFLLVETNTLGFDFSGEFELDLAQVKTAVAGRRLTDLQSAAALCRGDFLDGFSLSDAPGFDEWVTFQREFWRHQTTIVFDQLTRQQSAAHAFAAGIETAVRWLAHDPLNEAAHRQLIRMHYLAGNRTAALQAVQACRALLAKELDAAPDLETEALARLIKSPPPNQPADAWALRPARQSLRIPFVGRADQHARMAAAYHESRQGRAQVVTLEGEAGIGKTRLAQEFLSWVAAQGADVLHGRAFEAAGRLPFQPVLEALRNRVERENAPEDLLSDIWLSELSRLLPELCDRYPDLPSPTRDESLARTRLLEAVARLGHALAARAPLVLFVDDIQWADAASLDVLHYCGRAWAVQRVPIMLLLTLRSELPASSPAIGEWLSGLGRDISLTRLTLDPISGAETQELVARMTGAPEDGAFTTAFARWLFNETAGQPFYIAETIKTLLDRGALQLHLDDSGSSVVAWQIEGDLSAALPQLIPAGIREIILSRLRPLTQAATALITAAAVVGRGCSFEILGQVAGLPAGEGLAALDDLLAGRLLVEKDDPLRPYTFAHDKVREVVYTEAGAARRRLYHRQAFTILEATAAPAELAHHALAAHLAEPAFRYSQAAGDAALRLFAVPDAILHYENARRLLSTLGDEQRAPYDPAPEDREQNSALIAGLFTGLGRAYEIRGALAEAQAVYQELLDLARRSAWSEATCIALNRLGTLATHAYEFEAAGSWLNEARRVADAGGNQAALAQTEWSLAQLAYHTFDYPTTVGHARAALALARERDDAALIAGSLNTLAYAEALLGQVQAAQAHMEEARDRYAMIGDRALEADCLTIMALTKLWQGHVAASIADARAAYTISHEIDNPWGEISSSNVVAIGLVDNGDYEAALAIAQQGRRLARGHDLVLVSFLNLLVLGIVHRALLAPAAARAAHLEAAALNERAPLGSLAEMSAAQLCADSALAGDWPAASAYAHEALTHRRYDVLPLVVSPLWPETAALLRAGEIDQAREDARRWGDLVGHIPRFRLQHLRALAVLAEWDEEPAQAIAHLHEALALAERVGLAGEQWPILVKLGTLYKALGAAARARQALDSAVAIVQSLAAKIDEETLKVSFLESETVRELMRDQVLPTHRKAKS